MLLLLLRVEIVLLRDGVGEAGRDVLVGGVLGRSMRWEASGKERDCVWWCLGVAAGGGEGRGVGGRDWVCLCLCEGWWGLWLGLLSSERKCVG